MEEKKIEDTGIFAILNTLRDSSYITPSVIDPLLAIGQQAKNRKYLEIFSNSILLNLTKELSEKIDKMPSEELDDIFMKLVPFINQPDISPIFDKIAKRSNSEKIMTTIHGMSPFDILRVFKKFSRFQIFQDKEIFEKCLIYRLEPLYYDHITLDFLTTFINAPSIYSERYQDVHNRCMGNYAKQIIELCCDNVRLYMNACKIIENIWLHTRNPLFAALRLELSQAAEKDGKFRDQYGKEICTPLYEFLDSPAKLPIINVPEMEILAHDPMVKTLIIKRFLQNVPLFIDKGRFQAPYPIYRAYMHYIAPGCSDDFLEDLLNYIIALTIASKHGMPTTQIIGKIIETLDAIASDPSKDPNVAAGVASNAANSLLCIAAKLLEQNLLPFLKLIEQIARTKHVKYSDITTAYVMLLHMLALDIIDNMLPVIINWCKDCPLISVLFLIFLDEIGTRNYEVAKRNLQKLVKTINVNSLTSVGKELCSKLMTFYEVSLSDSEDSDYSSY